MITVLDIETTMDFESSSSSPYEGQQMVFVGYTSFTQDLSVFETNGLRARNLGNREILRGKGRDTQK